MSTWRNELNAISRLMAPILVTQLAQAGYGFIDTVMAGQVSSLDLAAVAIGSGLWLPFFLLMSGIVMATTPLVAAAFGSARHADIPRITHQALWVGLGAGLIGMLVLQHISIVFPWLDVPLHLQAKTRLYLDGIALGMPPVALFCVLRYYSEALGHTRPIMVISIIGVLLNIPANLVFMYGYFGLPAMGGAGCGWATSVVMLIVMLVLLAYVSLAPRYARYRLLKSDMAPVAPLMRHIVALGLPIGIAIFFEISVFSMIAVLVSPLGETVVAAHQVSLSVTSLLFMIPLSLAISMTIRVGQAYGRRQLDAIQLTRRTGFLTTIAIASLSALLIILFRYPITGLYTTDPAVRKVAADLLLFAAGYQIFDAVQVAAAGCLRGAQETRSPMIMTLIAYWGVALPVGYGLGMTTLWVSPSWGAYGFWTGLVAGLGIACLLLSWRLGKRLSHLANVWR